MKLLSITTTEKRKRNSKNKFAIKLQKAKESYALRLAKRKLQQDELALINSQKLLASKKPNKPKYVRPSRLKSVFEDVPDRIQGFCIKGKRKPTRAEEAMIHLLRKCKVKFVFQMPLEHDGGYYYILDFYIPIGRVVIEVDGATILFLNSNGKIN